MKFILALTTEKFFEDMTVDPEKPCVTILVDENNLKWRGVKAFHDADRESYGLLVEEGLAILKKRMK